MPPKQEKHHKLSRREMIDRVNEIRREKGIPIDAAERYDHQIKNHLTPYQQRAVKYLTSKGKDTSFITDTRHHSDHKTALRQRYENYLDKRVSKPNRTYSPLEYDVSTNTNIRASPRKSPTRQRSSSPSKPLESEKPPLHPRHRSPTRTRSKSPVKESSRKRPTSDKLETRSSKRKQLNEKQIDEKQTISFSIFDHFGNPRKLSLDLNDKDDYNKTFSQLFQEQCLKLEGQLIIADEVVCRPDNTISLCVQNDSEVYLEYRSIRVLFGSSDIKVPSYTKIEEIKKMFGISPQLRLYVKNQGTYLPPTSYLANFALDELAVRAEHQMEFTINEEPQEIPPLAPVEQLYELVSKKSTSAGYLFVKRNKENCLIQPLGCVVEDVLKPNDELFIKDINLSIYYEIEHLESSGHLEIDSSSTVKDILVMIDIDSKSFDVIRTLDNQTLRSSDIIACCLMPGHSVKISRKKPILTSMNQIFYQVQKGKEFKTTQPFSSKTSCVFDLVQSLNKDFTLPLSQHWMVSFKNDQMMIPLSFFHEESNLSLTIPSGSFLCPTNLYDQTLNVRISLNGYIFEKPFNPSKTFKDNLIQCGFFPDPNQYDCTIQSPSSFGKQYVVDVERDMMDIEQNSLLSFVRRTDLSED